MSITHCECVFVALVIQHEMRMLQLPSVACPALQYFPTLSHKRHDFRKKKNVTERKMCDLIFSTILFQTFHIVRRNEQGKIKKIYISLQVVYPLFLSEINEI